LCWSGFAVPVLGKSVLCMTELHPMSAHSPRRLDTFEAQKYPKPSYSELIDTVKNKQNINNACRQKASLPHEASALQTDEKTRAGTDLDPLLEPNPHIKICKAPTTRKLSFFSPLSPEAVCRRG